MTTRVEKDVVEVSVITEHRVTRCLQVALKPGLTKDDAMDPQSWAEILSEDEMDSKLLDVVEVEDES